MFFGKEKRAKNNDRVPPNQNVTTQWPVLHYGNVPYYEDLASWDLKIFGLIEKPTTLSFQQLMDMPQVEVANDIHCVTGWSKLDNVWKGIRASDVLKKVKIHEKAKFVMLHAEENWTTNIPLEDFICETSILAHTHNNQTLTPEHGYPLRVVIPHLYFWKSAKWLRGIELIEEDKAGFWERNGYHMYGDPFKEQRFSWD